MDTLYVADFKIIFNSLKNSKINYYKFDKLYFSTNK